MIGQAVERISPEEYLRLERTAEIKSEYHDGRVYPFYGVSLRHSEMQVRLGAKLLGQLPGKDCHVCNSSLRVQVATKGPIVYPDISVVCGAPQCLDAEQDVLLNPVLVVKIETGSVDAFENGFALYRRIESLRDYVSVCLDAPRIEVWSKVRPGEWVLREFVGMSAVCRIPSLNCELALASVYATVSLETD